MRWFGVLVVLVLAGCPWTVPTPFARVHHGPAFRTAPVTLAALPVVCAAERELCTLPHAIAVANATRMTLEFAGYSIVDTERLNAESRRRRTRTFESLRAGAPPVRPPRDESRPPPDAMDISAEVEGGAAWLEAAPAEQLKMLVAMGVDGVLTTRIAMGAPWGLASERTVTTSVTVARLDGTLVWHSECDVQTGDYHSGEQAMELATNCALESANLW